MSKEMRDYLVLALPRSVIGPENLRHLLNQSNTDRVLVTRVFPRFCWLALIIYEFSLANGDLILCFDWP